jgi:anti-sigma factor RsiW
VICEQTHRRGTDYLEGALSTAERWRYRAHLARCRSCRAELRQLRLTVDLLRRVGPPPISEPARADVMAMFRRWQPPAAAPLGLRVPRASGLLSALERLLRGRRGLFALAALLLGSFVLAALLKPEPGAGAPALAGLECMLTEVLAGLVPLLAVGALAWQVRRAVSPYTFAAVAALGALFGQAAIHFDCPPQHLHIHAAFHVAGVFGALVLGIAASSIEIALLRRAR